LFQPSAIRVKDARLVTGAGRDTLSAVETIEGSSKADVMRGSAGKDDLRGGGGNDRIYGLGGDDVIFIAGGTASGGPGVDFIQASGRSTALGGADSDQIVVTKGPVKALGGPAPDTFKVADPGFTGSVDGQGAANQLDFSVHTRAVTVNIGKGRATWKGGHMTLRNIDNTLGTTKGDTMIGSAGNDYLNGLGGNDTLRGLGGNDFLIGDKGVDFTDGGPAFDICLAERTRSCP
jgi:Ca2+-binding RTX toxin-like protein